MRVFMHGRFSTEIEARRRKKKEESCGTRGSSFLSANSSRQHLTERTAFVSRRTKLFGQRKFLRTTGRPPLRLRRQRPRDARNVVPKNDNRLAIPAVVSPVKVPHLDVLHRQSASHFCSVETVQQKKKNNKQVPTLEMMRLSITFYQRVNPFLRLSLIGLKR